MAGPKPLLEKTAPDQLPEALRDAWERSFELRGDATFFEVFGSHPELFRWYSKSFYGDVFRRGRAPRRLKELLRLRLSHHHGCRFCNQGNRIDARNANISQAQIDAIDEANSDVFSDQEQAVLQLADRMALTNGHGRLDTDLYQSLRRSGLDDGVILELGMIAGILSGVAKFLFAFDLVEREDNCPFPNPPIEE